MQTQANETHNHSMVVRVAPQCSQCTRQCTCCWYHTSPEIGVMPAAIYAARSRALLASFDTAEEANTADPIELVGVPDDWTRPMCVEEAVPPVNGVHPKIDGITVASWDLARASRSVLHIKFCDKAGISGGSSPSKYSRFRITLGSVKDGYGRPVITTPRPFLSAKSKPYRKHIMVMWSHPINPTMQSAHTSNQDWIPRPLYPGSQQIKPILFEAGHRDRDRIWIPKHHIRHVTIGPQNQTLEQPIQVFTNFI